MSHVAYLIKDERKVRGDVISPPALKLLQEIVAPIGPLEFHTVTEKGPETVRSFYCREKIVRHFVEEMERGIFVIMIENWPGSTGAAIDNRLESSHFNQSIQDVIARRDINRDSRGVFFKRDVNPGRECGH